MRRGLGDPHTQDKATVVEVQSELKAVEAGKEAACPCPHLDLTPEPGGRICFCG